MVAALADLKLGDYDSFPKIKFSKHGRLILGESFVVKWVESGLETTERSVGEARQKVPKPNF